ncbi:MAG: serine--tRNA ligase, partial [Syntrophales bacterium]
MLDIKFLRQNIDLVRKKMRERGQEINLEAFAALDEERRRVLQEVETLRNERNTASKEIGEKKKKKEDASPLIAKMSNVSNRIKELDESLKKIEEDLGSMLMIIPNIPHESVVYGMGSEDNLMIRVWGEKPQLAFTPKPHWEIGEDLNILDFARGAKITGARFTLYLAWGAMLERALINFMLDLHTSEHGYTEVLTPFMVNSE